MTSTKKIKEFWKEQAKEFKESDLATAPDTYYRDLEINRIEAYLKDAKNILDIGCGNGYSTIKFAKKYKKAKFLGIDYSEEMVKYASKSLSKNKNLKNRVKFAVGDVLSLSKHLPDENRFDFIISERCLINLRNWEEQKKALLEMKKILKKNGRIILCENTQEGLARLNELRKRQNLFSIKVRWHNFYMPEKKLIEFSKKHFRVEDINNIGSLYYIISRVVYAKLAALENKEPEYLHPINKIASQLPSIGNFSPNYIFLLKNKV
ncbi:MAG: class I SAM-dependent methyltransferase [Patescibacteria group bacterium]